MNGATGADGAPREPGSEPPVETAGNVGPAARSAGRTRGAYLAYRGGAEALRVVPRAVASGAACACGLLAGALQPAQRAVVRDNLAHVLGERGSRAQLDRLVWRAYADYGRYWADVARLDAGGSPGTRHGFTLAGEELLPRRAGGRQRRRAGLAAPRVLGGRRALDRP